MFATLAAEEMKSLYLVRYC